MSSPENCSCSQSQILTRDLEKALDVLKMVSCGIIGLNNPILQDKIETTKEVLDTYGYGKDDK